MKTNKQDEEPRFRNLLDVQRRFPDEKSCREYLEQARWHGKIVCVHCGSSERIYRINDGKLFKCSECRKQFSVRVGTFFEDSALLLQKWFFAIFIFSAHKKGISSCQLARDINVRQATAWFMLHRIRQGMSPKLNEKQLKNIVEADETYIGGKGHKGKPGRGSENKAPVFGMAERGGNLISQPIKRANAKTLQGLIEKAVYRDATIMTDEWSAYNGLSKEFEHKVVNHSRKEYVNGDIHVNTIESFWALLKRGIFGIYHHVSPEHLHRYCNEFQYRYNTRKIEDSERFTATLGQCQGRLTYDQLIG